MKKLFVMMALAAFAFAGCKVNSGSGTEEVGAQPQVTQSDTTCAVVVGMENSDCFGACPGAGLDAKRMKELLGKYTKNITFLTDKQASYKAVTDAIKEGIAKSELFIFYYSGHGGSERFADTGAEEEDGMDEFYCLNDRYMRDNDMWAMITKSNGRILLINDACHSKSLYRSPCITLRKAMGLSAVRGDDLKFSMMCWSGCPDDTFSYGSATGGKFTNTLLKYFSDDMTYQELWSKISTDKSLQQYENPQETIIGDGFDGKKVFR